MSGVWTLGFAPHAPVDTGLLGARQGAKVAQDKGLEREDLVNSNKGSQTPMDPYATLQESVV